MKTIHLTDIEIQQHVFHEEAVGQDAKEHTRHCESCQMRVREYTLLFNVVGQQSKPQLEFDLSKLVMSQLIKPKTNPIRQRLIIGCIWMFSVIVLGTTFFLFGKPLLDLLSSESSITLYAATAFVAALTLFLVIENYREFQGELRQLNFN